MSDQYKMGITVMSYLQSLGLNMLTIGEAVDDRNLEKSYNIIINNPNISKDEFLKIMQIEEVDY